ncbi:hypothetical protein LJ655_22765 [Paraburkholderia sp. MMS20-SJTN17]|uniref:Uncharacterized protein n=1 Tax=Paraburkholderia translucens TaxID=2886945 RepID=A0ABS8KJQ0_9BURK|nr:hypothetical protein [Paraburkholderia sp. MMS20-SJTN17]MCC8404663.1 hypothetical protein [Paraburkholderia sp. MMS20-SJTN17]
MFDPAFGRFGCRSIRFRAADRRRLGPLYLRTRKRNPIEPDANNQAKLARGGSGENRQKFAKLLFVK